jgi:plasmid maintenance system antidote protein VapI
MAKKKPIDPVEILLARVHDSSIAKVAGEIGVSAAYISSILAGTRRCSDKVLTYLGLKRVVTIEYRPLAP